MRDRKETKAKAAGVLAPTPLVVLSENDMAYKAARAMKDHNIGCVVVCGADGRLSGIVTDRDLALRSICDGLDPNVLQLRHVMTPNPAAVVVDQDRADAIWMMRSLGVRRVPIVSLGGKPVGLITLDDLMLEEHADRGALREVVSRQLAQPTRLSPEGVASIRRTAIPSPLSVSSEVFHTYLEEGASALHEARAAQTLGRMLKLARSCLESFNVFALERGEILVGLRTFLNALVRRIDAGAAGNLIAQLPSQLQEELCSQPAGPDVSIDRAVIERLLRRALHLKGDEAGGAFDAYATTLGLSIATGEIRAMMAQLPHDMHRAFEDAIAPAPKAA